MLPHVLRKWDLSKKFTIKKWKCRRLLIYGTHNPHVLHPIRLRGVKYNIFL